jgi:hypothetical protein
MDFGVKDFYFDPSKIKRKLTNSNHPPLIFCDNNL